MGKRLASADREAHAPAIAVARPEQGHLPHDVRSRHVCRKLTIDRFGDHEPQIVGETIGKPLTRMRSRIGMSERGFHPDLSITQFDRKGWYIVGPKIKGTAASEIETGVVPMAGQNAIVDAAPLERESHVRATVIEGRRPARDRR